MKPKNPTKNSQIVYLSHGGGPLPILEDPGHKSMVDFMLQLPSQLRYPDAILVISAHWEENVASRIKCRTKSTQQTPIRKYRYIGGRFQGRWI